MASNNEKQARSRVDEETLRRCMRELVRQRQQETERHLERMREARARVDEVLKRAMER